MKVFTEEEQNSIFGNIDELEPISKTLLETLHDKSSKWDTETTEIGNILTNIVNFFPKVLRV